MERHIQATRWVVFSGGPSSGKTTVARRLEEQGHRVQEDVVRTFIQRRLAAGATMGDIRSSPPNFYWQVLDLISASEATLNPSQSLILENGLPDALAYFSLYSASIPELLVTRALAQARRYSRVFLFEPLQIFEQDEVRVETLADTRQVFRAATYWYGRAGYEPVIVPRFCDDRDSSIASRLEFVVASLV